MSKIEFHLLPEITIDACCRSVCQLVEQYYQNGKTVYLHTDSPTLAKQLDDLLWIFRDISFLPHEIYRENSTSQAPILIGINVNILNENRFPGLAQIDSSSLDFPLGGDEPSLRSVLDIHDSSERESQQRGKPKCEEYTVPKMDILINLTTEIIKFYKQFTQVLEVVPNDETLKTSARQRYKYYKEQGEELGISNFSKTMGK